MDMAFPGGETVMKRFRGKLTILWCIVIIAGLTLPSCAADVTVPGLLPLYLHASDSNPGY